MRQSVTAFTLIALAWGTAYGAGWPHRPTQRAAPGCATCPGAGAYEEESPLYPVLTRWTFQKSQCQEPGCGGGPSPACGRPGAAPAFPYYAPPLPYSPQYLPQVAPAVPAGQR